VYTRYYVPGYEKTVKPTGTQELHYIECNGNSNAIYVIENGVGKMYYIHKDHLGSFSTITDETGAVVAEQNFDAWGRKRNPADWSYSAGSSNPNWLYRGYTGHEHLEEFALINMNGRCYDPIISRMLNADNFVQASDNTQSYNRYSYVINNPIRYKDMSGYWWTYDDLAIAAAGFMVGVCYHVYKTGEFNVRTIMTGFQFAAAAWLSWNTPGISAYGAGNIIGSMIANLSISEIAPPVTIASGNGFTLSASMGGFAPSGFAPSINMSLNYKKDFDNGAYIAGGVEVGASSSKASEVTKKFGSEVRIGGGIEGGSINGFGAGVSTTYFGESDGTTQRVGTIMLRYGDFKLRYDNDWQSNANIISDGFDRFRTAALQVSYKGFNAGFKVVTGDPGPPNQKPIGCIDGHDTYIATPNWSNPNQYRLGALYGGYQNFQVGWNSEQIRHQIQNRFAHDILQHGGAKWFEVLQIQPSMYGSYGNRYYYSSW
jgi:RHS repeat-associated protein